MTREALEAAELDPQVILDIDDPFDRFEAAARAMESAQQLITDLRRIKAEAVLAATAGRTEAQVAKRLGLSQPNVHIYVKSAREGISTHRARQRRPRP